MTENPPPPLEHLLEHADWIRALASRLVDGSDRADDLTQDTLLTAMRERPRRDRALRSWLAQVLRRKASNLHREEGRRRVRERAVARPEHLPATVEVVAEAAIHRRVTTAVLGLDEPSRSTLLLRYFRGWSPTEIARDQGIPKRTVETRLRRGLGRLRRMLDDEHDGDREAWTTALLPLTVAPGPAAASTAGIEALATQPPALVGVSIVSSKAKIVGAGLILGSIVATGVWTDLVGGRDEGPQNADQRAGASPGLLGRAGRPNGAPSGAALDAVRTASDHGTGLVDAHRGQVLGPEGQPVAGCRLLPAGARYEYGEGSRSTPYQTMDADDALAVTDVAGRFSLSEIDGDVERVVFAAEGMVARSVPFEALAEDEFVVRLEKGRSIRGIVRDSEDRPVHGALVAIRWRTAEERVAQTVRTDDRGAYVFESVAVQPAQWMSASAFGYSPENRREPGTAEVQDFQLRRSGLLIDVEAGSGEEQELEVRGVLCSARDGAFVDLLVDRPQGREATRWAGRWPSGRLRPAGLRERRGPREVVAHVFAAGRGGVQRTTVIDGDEEEPHWILSLPPGEDPPLIEGRLAGADGPVVLELRLPHREERSRPLHPGPLLARTLSAENGRFSLQGPPAGRYELRALADGKARIARIIDAPNTDLHLHLAEGARLDVLCHDQFDQPVREARVWVHHAESDRLWTGQADEAGRIRFTDLIAGGFRVAGMGSEQENLPTARRVEDLPDLRVEVSPGEPREVRVLTPRPVSFALVVEDDRGRALPGAVVGLHARSIELGHPDAPAAEAGLFVPLDERRRIELKLLPGRYHARMSRGFLGDDEWDFTVPDHDGAEHRVVIPSTRATIQGRIIDADSGLPLRCHVMAHEPDAPHDRPSRRVSTEGDGRYRLSGPLSGPITLFVVNGTIEEPGKEKREQDGHASLSITLSPGETRNLDLAIPTMPPAQSEDHRTIRVQVVDSTDRPRNGAIVMVEERRNPLQIARLATCDQQGAAQIPCRRAERYRLSWFLAEKPDLRHPSGVMDIEDHELDEVLILKSPSER